MQIFYFGYSETLERIANQWPSAELDALMPLNYST